MSQRHLSALDQFVCGIDRALRSLTPGTQAPTRPTPKPETNDHSELSDAQRRHAAGLMRVNHAGEVCAQALYQGQALTASLPSVRSEMDRAADEEIDHLAWCEERLNELDSRPSFLNPLWYGMSFALGAAAGKVGDRVSLGFVAATEEQVCRHLHSHLDQLPQNDAASKVIIEQMIVDEKQHGEQALAAGGYKFPAPVKVAMTGVSKVMTKLTYRV